MSIFSILGFVRFAAVIAAAEILFQPNIQADEKIAAAHFLHFEFWNATAPVVPGNGDNRPAIASHNCLQRQFNSQIEMRATTAVGNLL